MGPFLTPFPGGGGDACAGQPPDVAADASPNQAVEFLNQGIWIFDKSGNLQSGYPQLLSTFWSSLNPPSTNFLSDTQIAYEPISQRWLATTLSVTKTLDNGDLYFAVSQTSDATGAWSFYTFPSICSNADSTHPVPDMPVLGYNEDWAAIELQCLQPGGNGAFGTDQLVLIPHANISPPAQNLGQTIIAAPFFGARPSRDISGKAKKNLYLVASQVPSSSSLPYVLVTSVNSSGSFVGPGPNGINVPSPGAGVPGVFGMFAPAQHDSCGSGSTCMISLQDARIANVNLQTGNDGNHYLLTSFHAGTQSSNTAQGLWFVGKVESFASQTSSWNARSATASNLWVGYPTITMDSDLDAALTFDNFKLGSSISPSWYFSKGFSSTNGSWAPTLGSGTLSAAQSTGSYIGKQSCDSSVTKQRWGDYMSTIWDPNLSSTDEMGAFWTVQEWSTGTSGQPTSNQSTEWIALQDPTPFFLGSSTPTNTKGTNIGEAECGTAGNVCKLVYAAPSGAQFGDVFLADVGIGENGSISHLSLPAGWTALPLKNQGNSQALISSCSGCGHITSFLLMYVYGSQSGDTGQYTIGYTVQTSSSEMFGFLVSYRGANSVASNYVAYGYPGAGITSSFSTGSVSPAVGTTLLTLFTSIPLDSDLPEGDENQIFATLTGSPALTEETSPNVLPGWDLAADVAVSMSQTFGPYTVTTGNGLNFARQVVIPE